MWIFLVLLITKGWIAKDSIIYYCLCNKILTFHCCKTGSPSVVQVHVWASNNITQLKKNKII